MLNDPLLPYQPPTDLRPVAPAISPWRLIPASMTFCLGLLAFIGGAMIAIRGGLSIYTQPTTTGVAWINFLLACSSFFGLGIMWMMSGWYYYRARYTHAFLTASAGIMVIGLFAALSMIV